MQTLLGKKVGMTQVFNGKGEIVPVTIVEFDEAVVVDVKTEEKDGYSAVQLGCFDAKKAKKVPKPMKGVFKNEKKKKDLVFKNVIKEVRMSKEEAAKYKVGDKVSAEGIFKEGDFVDVTGVSKGKGFQGVMKRYGFHGGPGGHGSMHHRLPGSVGASSFPSRVFKNQKMPGRMGGSKVTAQNLLVEKYDVANKFMLIRGALPGSKNGVVLVKKSIKKKPVEKKGDKKK